MSRPYHHKNQHTIADLRNKIKRLEVLHEVSEENYKQETSFLRWTIAVALGLGFVIGVIFSKGF